MATNETDKKESQGLDENTKKNMIKAGVASGLVGIVFPSVLAFEATMILGPYSYYARFQKVRGKKTLVDKCEEELVDAGYPRVAKALQYSMFPELLANDLCKRYDDQDRGLIEVSKDIYRESKEHNRGFVDTVKHVYKKMKK